MSIVHEHAKDALNALLKSGADSTTDLVLFVDELLSLCDENRLLLKVQHDQCTVRVDGEGTAAERVPNPLRKSQLRAVLARIATVCAEKSNGPATPYGGEWDIWLNKDSKRQLRVSLQNTLDSQFVQIDAISSAESNDSQTFVSDEQRQTTPQTLHDQLSDLEDDMFSAISQQPSTPEFVVSTFLTFMPRFKDVVKQIVPDSKPLLFFFPEYPESIRDTRPKSLPGFDQIGGDITIADEIQRSPKSRGRTPYEVMSRESGVRDWQRLNRVEYILAMPIRAWVSGTGEVVGHLTITLNRECTPSMSAALGSIHRRFGLLFQQLMYLEQITEPVQDSPSE